MENNSIVAGLVETAEDIEANARAEEIKEYQLAINFLKSIEIFAADEYDKPKFTLYKNGIGFAPLGNIMAICAEMKMGKSWLMQQMAVALLKGEFMGLSTELETPNILYFDTEQDKYDSQMVMRRVQYLCGWDFKTDNPQFHIYSMRDFDKYNEDLSIPQNRIIAISKAIEIYRPHVVFVDGVRDLIDDFNDLSESARLVQELMSITSKYNCCIWSVLHVNPNSDKMRGHLGTELGNKVTDVFSVHKNKDQTTGEVSFEVKQVAARHRDVDDWLFKINDSGKFAVPELVDATFARKQELRIIFNKAFKDQGNRAMTWSDMYDKVHDVEKKRRQTILGWLTDGVKLGMINESCGKYIYISE